MAARSSDRSTGGRERRRRERREGRADHEEGRIRRNLARSALVSCGAWRRPTTPRATTTSSSSSATSFAFNAFDFEQRVVAAAVKLGLIEDNELDDDETADLVELAADGRIADARSALGALSRPPLGARSRSLGGESLVYWLRKLVFRGAWLDHRVKEGLLEVAGTRTRRSSPTATRAAAGRCSSWRPCRRWHELQFKR